MFIGRSTLQHRQHNQSNHCTDLLWRICCCCIVPTRRLPWLHGYPKSALLHCSFSHIASVTTYCSWNRETSGFSTTRWWRICYAVTTLYRLVATFRVETSSRHYQLCLVGELQTLFLWRESKFINAFKSPLPPCGLKKAPRNTLYIYI
jgi:hypothetical protein